MSNIEHLTGLLNRAAFDVALLQQCAEAAAEIPLALVMADVDHFKKINDSHGHPAGDTVLRSVADAIQRVVKGKGTAYRYGGEEFALILPNHSCDEAIAVAERVRLAVEAVQPLGLRVTSSFGVAVVPQHAANSDEALKKADVALYDAKQRGRNVVRFSGEPAPEPNVSARVGSARKAPKPGEISDADKERLRREILRSGQAGCPSCEDDMPLTSHDVTSFGESGKSFIVHCPACGFNTNLPGPSR